MPRIQNFTNVTRDSILATMCDSTRIVKIIHNIHAEKQLERYLLSTSELLMSLFDSVQSGLLILDSSLKIIKVNKPFYKLFQLIEPFPRGLNFSKSIILFGMVVKSEMT